MAIFILISACIVTYSPTDKPLLCSWQNQTKSDSPPHESTDPSTYQSIKIESTILRLLKESTGNILDDVELIDTLAASKKTSETINAKVEEAHVTEKEIDANREKYRPVAYHVSILCE